MIAPHYPPDPAAALAARWREDAEVLRRHGATGRARMLERLAEELECCAAGASTGAVDLDTAAELSGFTRAHLRRLIRTGKLPATVNAAGRTEVRVADLPRKPGGASAAPRPTAPSARRAIVQAVLRSTRELANTALHEAAHAAGADHSEPTWIGGYDVYSEAPFSYLSPGVHSCLRY